MRSLASSVRRASSRPGSRTIKNTPRMSGLGFNLAARRSACAFLPGAFTKITAMNLAVGVRDKLCVPRRVAKVLGCDPIRRNQNRAGPHLLAFGQTAGDSLQTPP